VLLEKSMFLP